MSSARVLVLGGTGFVGRALCEHLVRKSGGAAGRVLVPTRHAMRGNGVRFLPTVDIAEANVHDEAALNRLVAGQDVVVNLVATLHGSAAEFERVHVALPRRLAAACKAAGVRRVLHVSALGVGASPGEAPSRYLRSKTEGEAVLKAAGLDLTLVRPSVIFGAEDRFLNLFAGLQWLFPVLPLAGGSARFQPVWVDDVAEAIVRCIHDRGSIGQTYELAGPTEYTLSQLVQLAGRWSGRERLQIALPAALGRLQALLMELLPGQPLMSRDNLDSMRVPNVPGGQLPGFAALGIRPSALEAIAPQYLGSRFARARLNLWREGAGRR